MRCVFICLDCIDTHVSTSADRQSSNSISDIDTIYDDFGFPIDVNHISVSIDIYFTFGHKCTTITQINILCQCIVSRINYINSIGHLPHEPNEDLFITLVD